MVVLERNLFPRLVLPHWFIMRRFLSFSKGVQMYVSIVAIHRVEMNNNGMYKLYMPVADMQMSE